MKGKSEISNEAEEYLEAIYRLEETYGIAKTMQLVRLLKVAPGSVTNTIEHLEKHELVLHTPYKGVKLTAKGRRIALKILRKHRLAERLLTDFLKIEWSDVHELACKLEHAMVDQIVFGMEKALGYPKTCPHGNPIPPEHGVTKNKKGDIPLSQLETNEHGVIAKITDENREKLRLLADLGLKPGVKICMVHKTLNDMKIRITGKTRSKGPIHPILDNKTAATVWVKVSKVRDK